MPENEKVMSNKDRYMERLKAKYPDKEYADDEALYGQINDDYDEYDKQIGTFKEQEKAMSDMFVSNPRSAAFLTDWRNGLDPVVSFIQKFGDELKEALEDPDKQEALAEANRKYAERIAEEDKFEEEYQKNIQETLNVLESIQQEQGLTDDDVDKAMEFLVQVAKDGMLGKFSKESVMMAMNAINHDSDVEEASHEGEMKGRNAKITEKLRKSSRSDGTASLGGKNGGGGSSKPTKDLGAIGRYEPGYNNIWERGGEKRKKKSSF